MSNSPDQHVDGNGHIAPPTAEAAGTTHTITVYWRPGCPFCSMLRSGLRREGIPVQEINIWEDADAAAFVRSVANGNETVPTVTIGSVSLVNPSAREVAETATRELPGFVFDEPEQSLLGKLIHRH